MNSASAGGAPPLSNPPSWQNDTFHSGSDRKTIVLWHGCLAKHAKSIKAKGIDYGKCSPDSDFGRGFYCTTLQRQAQYWADWKWRELPNRERSKVENSPALIQYRVSREELAKLHSLHMFVRHEHTYEDFWSFVWNFRNPQSSTVSHHCTGSTTPQRTNWYDVVSGPVTLYWNQRVASCQYDQISFHTDEAKDVMDPAFHSILPTRPANRSTPAS